MFGNHKQERLQKLKSLLDFKNPNLGFMGGNAFASYPSAAFDLTQLVGYYKYDEVSGNLINQATAVGSPNGNGIDGVAGGTTGPLYQQSGIIGDSIKFAPAQAIFTAGVFGEWSFMTVTGATSTLCAWFNIDNFNAFNVIMNTNNAGSVPGFSLDVTGSQVNFRLRSGVGALATLTHGLVLSTGTWYFAAARFDEPNNTATLSVNDAGQITDNAVLASNGTQSQALRIGNNSSLLADGTDGRIDESSLWGRLLSDPEITALYNGGAGLAL